MNDVKTIFDTNTLIVGENVNVMSNGGKNFECSYEVTFNGEDRVDVVMPGSSIGWVPRFSITLTPPESTHVYKMLYEFVDWLEPRPFENMGVDEYETNVEMAADQLALIKQELVEMANENKPFLMPKTWRMCFDFMIRPVMRFSQPVFAEDIKFAYPIPEGFANLGFVRASDVKAEVGMRLLAQYVKDGPYEPCEISDARPYEDAPEILFQVKFTDGRFIGVFNDELVKILNPDEVVSSMTLSSTSEKDVTVDVVSDEGEDIAPFDGHERMVSFDPASPDGDQTITGKLSSDFGDTGIIVVNE